MRSVMVMAMLAAAGATGVATPAGATGVAAPFGATGVAAPFGATGVAVPAGGPGPCWTEVDIAKAGKSISASAFRDCANADTPTPLSLALQIQSCDGYGCLWVNVRQGMGTVQYTCKPGEFGWFRSTRLPAEVVTCP